MPRQRPKSGYLVLVVITEPIRKPVTEHRTHGGGEPDRPEADAARADHSADTEQDGSGRQQERDERERFPEGENEDDRGSPAFVCPDEQQDRGVQVADGCLLNALDPSGFRRRPLAGLADFG